VPTRDTASAAEATVAKVRLNMQMSFQAGSESWVHTPAGTNQFNLHT
jgi:hypothetical protein